MNTTLRRRINQTAASLARAEQLVVRAFLVAAVTKLRESGRADLVTDYLEAVERAEFVHDPDAWLAERSAGGEPAAVLAAAPDAIAVTEQAS